MRPVLCLLPSPLLGPACWRPAAGALADRGWPVAEVPSPGAAPRTGADVLDAYLAAIPADRDVLLIPYSNAGLFVPALAARRPAAGYVFVDAGLPGPGVARTPMIPPGFSPMLAAKADGDGMLPPWTQWWDGEDLSGLFPDASTRAAVEAEQRRLPLSYFGESVPVPPGWPGRPGGYVAFGDGYEPERAVATALGWPVTTLAGGHLHMLVDPAQVADAITGLIAAISPR
jgi:hypothetical protein